MALHFGPKQDFGSICWLLVLYTLQGVPLGMSGVFPLLLKEQGASYSDLAWFSMCSWPFALKLLWAPIVDGIKFEKVGRRKSLLVPCQFAISILLYYLSMTYESLLRENRIDRLTLIFFCMYFFAATQDIAVDGWALTMLSKANVGYAGTCNSVGQTAGYFMAFSGFFGFSKLGICSLETFMQMWAAIFFLVTILVLFCKPEKNDLESSSAVWDIYGEMKSVLQLGPVISLSQILLSAGIPFIDGLLGVKFQDSGVSPDVIALLATLSTPVHIGLPWLVSRFGFSAKFPLSSYRKIFPVRLAFQLVSVAIIILTPYCIAAESPPALGAFYAACLVLSIAESAIGQIMFVSQMTFFARISDPVIGGTYMTVLNTISNIGGNLGKQLSYWLAELTSSESIDGFYVVVALVSVYGVFWIRYFGKTLSALERAPEHQWRVKHV